MHFIQAKSLLSSKNGMNIFRGCTHGCIYCDSRSLCYRMPHDFSDVAVKENAAELLDDALSRKRRKCMIGFGSMSDPYIPAERELCLTRRCLEVISRRGFGVSLITKSDLVLRDLDILKEINQKTKAVVSMTLTTADDELYALLKEKREAAAKVVLEKDTKNGQVIRRQIFLRVSSSDERPLENIFYTPRKYFREGIENIFQYTNTSINNIDITNIIEWSNYISSIH